MYRVRVASKYKLVYYLMFAYAIAVKLAGRPAYFNRSIDVISIVHTSDKFRIVLHFPSIIRKLLKSQCVSLMLPTINLNILDAELNSSLICATKFKAESYSKTTDCSIRC